jgi:ribosomal protein L22
VELEAAVVRTRKADMRHQQSQFFRTFKVVSILVVFCGVASANPASASAPDPHRPQKAQGSGSLNQILDSLTESAFNHDGLEHSNLAIDQIVQKSNRLIRKAARQRTKEFNSGNPDSPLSLVLGHVILTLTDCNSYLLKLKGLQDDLIAVEASADRPKVDGHETCKDLNLEFKAVAMDLGNLKLSIKKLPLPQKAIADVILLDTRSRVNSVIQRIRQRTLQVGAALNLGSELDLEAR